MKLSAEKRAAGTRTSRQLRREGFIPAVIYNDHMNIPVSVEYRNFDKAFRLQGTSNIIELDIAGESHDVLVKQVQMDKRRREAMHIDFYAVTAGQLVDVGVMINFVGTPRGIKEGGQLDVQRREVSIRILPRLIPHDIQVDISGLRIADSIHVADVMTLLPAEAEVLDEESLTLVTVVAPRVVSEDEGEEESLEPEVIGEHDEDDDDDA